jgi:endogenous inhibitor of DNA gyrase (YacG/DUF329 family)/uncharacterized Zn-finger protein
MTEITCKICGKPTIRKSYSQKYCFDCSNNADRARKLKWAKEHYSSVDRDKQRVDGKMIRPYRAMAGAIRNKTIDKGNAVWTKMKKFNEDYGLLFRFSVPFDQNYSKNALWRTCNRGHVYLRQEAKALRAELIYKIKEAGITWRVNKVHLDILVQKKNMRGDAINMIDSIADAIKIGINLDDNWFCIDKLDWEIVKENPKIFIGIKQKNCDEYPCSYCGKFLPLESFSKNKYARFGISSECRECLALARKLAKENKDKTTA